MTGDGLSTLENSFYWTSEPYQPWNFVSPPPMVNGNFTTEQGTQATGQHLQTTRQRLPTTERHLSTVEQLFCWDSLLWDFATLPKVTNRSVTAHEQVPRRKTIKPRQHRPRTIQHLSATRQGPSTVESRPHWDPISKQRQLWGFSHQPDRGRRQVILPERYQSPEEFAKEWKKWYESATFPCPFPDLKSRGNVNTGAPWAVLLQPCESTYYNCRLTDCKRHNRAFSSSGKARRHEKMHIPKDFRAVVCLIPKCTTESPFYTPDGFSLHLSNHKWKEGKYCKESAISA